MHKRYYKTLKFVIILLKSQTVHRSSRFLFGARCHGNSPLKNYKKSLSKYFENKNKRMSVRVAHPVFPLQLRLCSPTHKIVSYLKARQNSIGY